MACRRFAESCEKLLPQGVQCRGAGGGPGGTDSAQRFSSLPVYLPVRYQLSRAEMSFFLKEAAQDIMRNASLQVRAEPFFVQRAKDMPVVNATYGPYTVQRAVPRGLLQASDPFTTVERFTLNWRIRTAVLVERLFPDRPTVQVLFHITGRDWDDYSPDDDLPCVRLYGFWETREVRSGCRLAGDLGLCVAELELPGSWFEAPAVVPGRRKASSAGAEPGDGTAVELYYLVQPADQAGECDAGENRKGNAIRPGRGDGEGTGAGEWDGAGAGAGTAPDYLQRVGSIRLHRGSGDALARLTEVRLDANLVIAARQGAVKQGEVVTFRVSLAPGSAVEQFTLRAKAKKGVSIVEVRPSDPEQWDIQQELGNGGKHPVSTVMCRRKPGAPRQGMTVTPYEIMQMDFQMDNFSSLSVTRRILWQVEYPGSGGAQTDPEKAVSELLVSQRDVSRIVPLAMHTEIVNTAILTGKTVAVPVKVLVVEEDSTVTDVSELVACKSSSDDVLKVSDRCDYVLVNGKEMKGKVNAIVNFTYEHLSATLEITVWVPRLPLQIEVSDTELSQIKGWRIPVSSNKRPTRESDDEDDDERKGRGCTLQYQRAMVRVLTHFVAEPLDPGGQLVYMLGTDWQADITDIVTDFLKMDNPRIAKLQDGRILSGQELGITTIQVLSPLSDSILAEKTITVIEEKVTVTDLGIQLVTGLSLSFQLSPGSNRAIIATTAAKDELHTAKQEAILSAWIQFSDNTLAPLDIYDPEDFSLAVTSREEAVVSTNQDLQLRWPVVTAEGEGQGNLLKVEMVICEVCQKSKRKSILAVGNGNVKVKFSQNDGGPRGAGDHGADGDLENRASDRRQKNAEQERSGQDGRYFSSATADREESSMRKVSTTAKASVNGMDGLDQPSDDNSQLQNIPLDAANFPSPDLTRNAEGDDRANENDLMQAPRGLTDLEIGMYALLGVFCLAILVFLINCVMFALKYRHKRIPSEGQGNMNHSHDWVWLGNESELLENTADVSPQRDCEHTTTIDRAAGFEESNHLLNGGSQKNVQGQIHRSALNGDGKERKDEPLNSPTTKRKRVKFTTFTTIPPDDGCPATNSILLGTEDNIQWVCRDMSLGDSHELRNYMERIQDSV
ncbi:transmembrane protein 132C [Callorhinchus milii]|uniref:transmembrane protein 132C n=1 Tax=Callorhinchus milii TaxID=7868 RepID=UPI001C3F94FC|nr:transmembrane protein 132C [Callorhinchus milii]